jgi:hypothetical protein
MDVFKGQRNEQVLAEFKNRCTVISIVPGGCTSYVQVLDVSLNNLLKDHISQSWNDYMDSLPIERLQQNHFPIKEHRILITKWVGEAWEWLHTVHHEVIIKTFRQVGLSLPHDGLKDIEIKIRDLPNLEVSSWHREGWEKENTFFWEPEGTNTFDDTTTKGLPVNTKCSDGSTTTSAVLVSSEGESDIESEVSSENEEDGSPDDVSTDEIDSDALQNDETDEEDLIDFI